MTHPQQTTREVIEQLLEALDHCMGAITERGLNGSPDQAEKWGLQLPLERAYAALAAGQQALEQTQGEAEPDWFHAECDDPDYSGFYQDEADAITQVNDHGGEVRALVFVSYPAVKPQATEPAPSTEVLQALTDPENQPNQFGVVFGMRGPRMFFTIGNQSFDLAYEPDSTEEFEFMKRMLCSAFSTFTPDVRTAPAPSTAGERAQVVEIDTSQERVDKTAGNGDMVPLSAIRPIAVEAIRAVTGCPDIRGNDKYLVDEIEDIAKHAALLQSTAHHIGDANKMVAALPVGELTLEQITRIYDRYGGDMVNCTRAIERELAAARSQPTTEESLVVAGAQPVREPLTPDTHYQEWKHGCDSMCTNITLWIDRCPHCGKPRPVVEAAHGITQGGKV